MAVRRHLQPLLLVATLGCAACTSGNLAIKDETRATVAAKFVQGRSTQDQVRGMYGEPSRTVANNGTVQWTYGFGAAQPGIQNFIPGVSIFSHTMASQGKTLNLTFGMDGILQDYAFTEVTNNVHRGI